MTAKQFNPGRLQNAQQVGDGYYFLVEGTAPHDGKPYGFLTRGAGRQNAATRIPIRVKFRDQQDYDLIVEKAKGPSDVFDLLEDLSRLGYGLGELEFVYVVMPRFGNVVSGREINAPGGTGEPGESREQVAKREFDEEAKGLLAIATHNPSGADWMQFASGCYDEVQRVDVALVVGEPKKLVEGAIRFGAVALSEFPQWLKSQNNPDTPESWEKAGIFEPVDGKVALNILLFIQTVKDCMLS